MKKFGYIFLIGLLTAHFNFIGGARAETAGSGMLEELAANKSDGVKVERLTYTANGSALSYYDVETQESAGGDIYFNSSLGDGSWGIVRSKKDGSGAIVALKRKPASNSTKRFDMSADGKFISYTKENDNGGWDVYGFRCDAEKIEEKRITRENYRSGETPRIKTSPAVYSDKDGKYVIVFSISHRLYVVYSDGTAPGGASRPLEIELTDGEKTVSFSRLRLNPKYPNILMYRRNTAARDANKKSESDFVSKMYLVDWTKKNKHSICWNDYKQSGQRPIWSVDGERIGIQLGGAWTEFTVVKNGEIIKGLSPQTVKSKKIGPFSEANRKFPAVFYATYSKNGEKIAIATRSETDDGGKIYLMDARSGDVKYLCRSLFHGPEEDGQPRLRFINGDTNILFNTDMSYGKPESAPSQIYMIGGIK